MVVKFRKGDLAKNRSKGQSADDERSRNLSPYATDSKACNLLELLCQQKACFWKACFWKGIDIRKAEIPQICVAVSRLIGVARHITPAYYAARRQRMP